MSIGEVAGAVGAKQEWKDIARHRLTALDQEIARLQGAREYLRAALNCRYDHPAVDCRVMGAEIDRRLAGSQMSRNRSRLRQEDVRRQRSRP